MGEWTMIQMADTDLISRCGEKKMNVILGKEEEAVISRNEQIDVTNFGDAVLSRRKVSDLLSELRSIVKFETLSYIRTF